MGAYTLNGRELEPQHARCDQWIATDVQARSREAVGEPLASSHVRGRQISTVGAMINATNWQAYDCTSVRLECAFPVATLRAAT